MHSECQHQSVHAISVEGKRPDGTKWYECNNKKCRMRLCIRIVVEVPGSIEAKDAEHGVRLITKAVSDDGVEWNSVIQAKKRNNQLKDVAEVMGFLPPRTAELERGDGYVQHTAEAVDEFKVRFLRLIESTGKEMTSLQMLDLHLEANVDEKHPLYVLNNRLKCIDTQNREWQSPYLAQHPEEGKQNQLNKPQPPTTFSKEEGHHEQRESG